MSNLLLYYKYNSTSTGNTNIVYLYTALPEQAIFGEAGFLRAGLLMGHGGCAPLIGDRGYVNAEGVLQANPKGA